MAKKRPQRKKPSLPPLMLPPPLPVPSKATAAPQKVADEPDAEEKLPDNATTTVRLRPVFKKRLKRVADKYGSSIGEFVEHYLGELVEKEFRTIVEEELAELRGLDEE